MSKLLTEQEAQHIAARMTAVYGLPPPVMVNDDYYSSNNWGVKVEIVRLTKTRMFRKFSWPTKMSPLKVKDFRADNFEDALTKLQKELTWFDHRAKVAEQLREKYALEEAAEVLEEVLKQE